jgi:S1-C subfamily serine protease
MDRKVCRSALVVLALSLLAPKCAAQNTLAEIVKQQGRYTLSLDLSFSKKNPSPLQRVISFLDLAPNGYATGFLVGDGLVMTSYHVVSGDIGASKKIELGFRPEDQLEVRVHVNGCQATVINVDKDADLALLGICKSKKQIRTPAFQTSPSKDDKLLVIARPHGEKTVRRGTLVEAHTFHGQQYWFAKLEGHDGYSGSPVYNQKAEVIGVFSGYDWAQNLALISPGVRAQKLLADYHASAKP